MREVAWRGGWGDVGGWRGWGGGGERAWGRVCVRASRGEWHAASEEAEGWLRSSLASPASSLSYTRSIQIIGSLFAVAVAFLAGWWLTRLIAHPLGRIAVAMQGLTDGNNNIEVPTLDRSDEIGVMAQALAAFKHAAIEKQRLEQEAEAGRKAAEEERKKQEADRDPHVHLQREQQVAEAPGHVVVARVRARGRGRGARLAGGAPALRAARGAAGSAVARDRRTLVPGRERLGPPSWPPAAGLGARLGALRLDAANTATGAGETRGTHQLPLASILYNAREPADRIRNWSAACAERPECTTRARGHYHWPAPRPQDSLP